MKTILSSSIAILVMILSGTISFAEESTQPVNVTVDNFVRAESDHMICEKMEMEDVRPIDHLVAAGLGWGGLPRTAAFYTTGSVEKNDGKTPHAVTVRDVPVDAFWSITVYNADGYLEANEVGRNSFNNFSAEPNEDGSWTFPSIEPVEAK